MKRLLLFLFIFILWINYSYSESLNYFSLEDIKKNHANYISNLQLENWAFVIANPGYDWKSKIVPYFSNFASEALLEYDSEKYKNSVEKYINWYFSHMNDIDFDWLSGTIYDYIYDYKLNTEISLNDYDSVDSYASTFISLLWKYYKKTGDKNLFLKPWNKEKIEKIIYNIKDSVLNPSIWLSIAKKSYPISYTMDNIEWYKGLIDAWKIFKNVYNDYEKSKKYFLEWKNLEKQILKHLFLNDSQLFLAYFWAKSVNLNLWYPDALVQLFPSIFWMEIPNQKELYAKFNKNFPDWVNSKHIWWIDYSFEDKRFPSAFILYSSFKSWDYKSWKLFIQNTEKYFSAGNYPWPWNISESSWFLKSILFCEKNNLCREEIISF